jgi:hypothetical protein
MSRIADALRQLVIERAGNCCEYCRLHQDFSPITYEIDHIIARKHRGETLAENLCLTCLKCNRFKGTDISSIDEETGAITPLYNPRTMNWDDHFYLDGAIIVPRTAIGRVTEFMLSLNTKVRVNTRRSLLKSSRYPCGQSRHQTSQ